MVERDTLPRNVNGLCWRAVPTSCVPGLAQPEFYIGKRVSDLSTVAAPRRADPVAFSQPVKVVRREPDKFADFPG